LKKESTFLKSPAMEILGISEELWNNSKP